MLTTRLSSVFVLLMISCVASFGQNKTMGVGVPTPNVNAALHVESPGANQGFIMPRLTTAQRTAAGFQGVLSATDIGLMVYDTDLKGIYIWDGSQWGTAAKLPVPYVDTVTSIPDGGNAFRIVNNNTGVGNFGVAHFENLNPQSGFSAIFGRTTSATNGVADFIVNNTANNNDGIGVSTNGVGRAGSFTVNNATNKSFAVYAQSNGDSTGAAVHGNNTGNGFGVYGKSAGSKFASAAVYGEHVGTGDAAGAFRISNPASTFSGLFGETNGSGPAIFANNIGTGRGLQAQINNAANSQAAIRGFTNGLGNVAFLTISNAANDSSALYVSTNGTGPAIKAQGDIVAQKFIGDGSLLTGVGGFSLPRKDSIVSATGTPDVLALKYNNPENKRVLRIESLDATNASSAVSVRNSSAGLGLYVQNDNPSTASSAIFATLSSNNLAANPNPVAVYGEATGTAGTGASFRVTNATNDRPALYTETLGIGTTLWAKHSGTNGNAGYFHVSNASNAGASVYGRNDGTGTAISGLSTGTGLAASFETNNAANTNPALYVNSNATNAPALSVSQTGGFTGLSINVSGGQAAELYSNNGSQALYVANTGTGRAGQFTGSSSGNATLQAQNSGAGGSALALFQTNNGYALDVQQGGIRLSVATFAAPTTMNTKANVYNITSAGTYTLGTSGRLDGETVIITSEAGALVTVDIGNSKTVSLLAYQTSTFIFVNGSWRAVNAN